MRGKKFLKLFILSLVAVILMGIVGCASKGNDSGNNENPVKSEENQVDSKEAKEQFIKAIDVIMSFDDKGYEGNLEKNDEKYSEDEYGKFAPLIDIEKKHYVEVSNSINDFINKFTKIIEMDGLNTIEDFKKFNQAADEFEKCVNDFLDKVEKLNEDNIKELEGLDIPKKYKEVYINAKKQKNDRFAKKVSKIDEVVKTISSSVKEMVDLVGEYGNGTKKDNADEYLNKVKDIEKNIADALSSLENEEESFKNDIDKINDDFKKKVEGP